MVARRDQPRPKLAADWLLSQSLPENYILTQTDEQLGQRFPLICRLLWLEWGLNVSESCSLIRDHVGLRDDLWDESEVSPLYLLMSDWQRAAEIGVLRDPDTQVS